MFSISVVLAVFSQTAVCYHTIPYWVSGHNQQPHVHANISGISIPLTMKLWYRTPWGESLRWRHPQESSIISLGEFQFVDEYVDPSVARPGVSLDLEVGPDSQVFVNITSVSLWKSSNVLVLDATEDQFLAGACHPDSSVSVPFFAMPAISLGWISSSHSGDYFMHDGLRSVSFSGVEDSAMFLLPPELAEEVYAALTSVGAEPAIPEFRNEMRFLNCTQDLATQVLPSFELHLTDNNNVALSRIPLFGEDYMSFDANDFTCRSKFHVRDPSHDRESFVIDPFQLPGISVRSTNNAITFCDSL